MSSLLLGFPVVGVLGFLAPVAAYQVIGLADGRRIKIAGIVLVRQKPGSAKGVVFATIEDETGVSNIVVWPAITERFRREVLGARLLLVEGRAQRSREGIVHIIAERLVDRSVDLLRLTRESLTPALARADEVRRPLPEGGAPSRGIRHPRNVWILPKSRDFH